MIQIICKKPWAQVKRVLVGFEISGQGLHLGHHIILRYLQSLAGPQRQCLVLLSGVHASLNDKPGDLKDLFLDVGDGEMRQKRRTMAQQIHLLYPRLKVISYENQLLASAEYLYHFLALVRQIKPREISRSLPADLEAKAQGGQPLPLKHQLYVAYQLVDSHLVGADAIVAGLDQRKIYMRVRQIYPRLGWPVPQMVFFPLLCIRGVKISKSAELDMKYTLTPQFYQAMVRDDPRLQSLWDTLRREPYVQLRLDRQVLLRQLRPLCRS